MTFHDRSYKNRPRNLARETGRIVRDLIAESTQTVDKVSSNLYAIPSAPITTSEGTDAGSCCCDRVVYVSKDGSGDFDSIQQAIDDIDAYEAPTADVPWAVWICPGKYDEKIVGINNVSLVGIGNANSVIVSSTTGPVYTLPDIGGHALNIKFELAPTTTGQTLFHTAGTHTGPTEIRDCIFDITSATNDIVAMFVNLQGGELFLKSNYMNYDMDGTHANVKSHKLINISGTSTYHIYNCEVKINVADINDTVIFVNELTTSTAQGFISFNEINAALSHASYAGTAGLFYLHGAGTSKLILGNHLVLTSAGGAGDTGYIIYMDTTATGGVVNSIANHAGCFSFDDSYSVNVAAGDTINSHFDKVYAVDGWTGAGTFNFAGSYSDGNFSVSNNVNILNECRWLEGVNHVGFKAPALAGNQIWELPDADGNAGEAMVTDGAGALSFAFVAKTFSVTYAAVRPADAAALFAAAPWVNQTINPPPLGPPPVLIAQVDYPRRLNATIFNIDLFTNTTGTITFNGFNADGAVLAEVITIDVPPGPFTSYTTLNCFALLTSVVIVKTDAHPPGDQFSLGVTAEWGVPNIPLNAAGDVYKATINGIDSGILAVDTAYGAVTLTGVVIGGADIFILYRPFK